MASDEDPIRDFPVYETPRDEEEADLTEVTDLAEGIRLSFKLREFTSMLHTAEELPVTPMKTLLAVVALVSFFYNIAFIDHNFSQAGTFNQTAFALGDSVGNANFLVSVMEFSIMTLLCILLATWIVLMTFKYNQAKYTGGNFNRLVKIMIFMANFSLVKGCADMKMYANYCADYWTYLSSGAQEKGKHSCFGCPQFIFWTGVKLGWIVLSVLAFFLKLSQVRFVNESLRVWSMTDYFVFLGFLNNMVSLTNPWAIQLQSVYKFMFAGSDAQFQANELRVLQEFQEAIVYRIIKAKGVVKGMILLLNWSYYDVQKVLLEPGRKFRMRAIPDDAPAPGEMYAKSLSQQLVVRGQSTFMAAFDVY